MKSSLASNVKETLALCFNQQQAQPIVVALSAGIDSVVLLHLLHSLQGMSALEALHVHHGLQSHADQWQTFCAELCENLGVVFKSYAVNAQARPGESPEAAARRARYHCFATQLAPGSVLCLAHHQNDQAETMLLQLLRGAGLKGLSAMPVMRQEQGISLCRPLLQVTREELVDYAKAHDLRWLEDPSNSDTAFDRNYLRHTIMPLLKTRWPQVTRTLARSAECCQQAQQALEQRLNTRWPESVWASLTWSVSELRSFKRAEQADILRHWFAFHQRSMPSYQGMQMILDTVVDARMDASPQYVWQQSVLRRYRDQLYLLQKAVLQQALPEPLSWDLHASLQCRINDTLQLHAKKRLGQGVCCERVNGLLSVRFRTGGERFHPHDRSHSQSLKKLLQTWGVPPWQRAFIPLLYCQTHCVAVAGLSVAQGYYAKPDEWGWVFEWQFCQ